MYNSTFVLKIRVLFKLVFVCIGLISDLDQLVSTKFNFSLFKCLKAEDRGLCSLHVLQGAMRFGSQIILRQQFSDNFFRKKKLTKIQYQISLVILVVIIILHHGLHSHHWGQRPPP